MSPFPAMPMMMGSLEESVSEGEGESESQRSRMNKEEEDADDLEGRPSSSSSSSSAALSSDTSIASSELMDDEDDATSSSSCSSCDAGSPLFEMSHLMEQLPIKRGLSKHFQGKSQSFSSLAVVNCLEDLVKKPVTMVVARSRNSNRRRQMKSSQRHGGVSASCKPLSPKGITKKTKVVGFFTRRPPVNPRASATNAAPPRALLLA